VPIVAVLAAGRLITCTVFFVLCLRVLPALRHSITFARSAIRPLFVFGSWMTVSNVVSPLMTTLDRFIVGALISADAVAYYATPYDVTSKMQVIPIALVSVLFPTFSAEVSQDRARVTQIFGRGVKHIFLALFPVTLILIALGHDGLRLWLGSEFARHSAPVLQILAIGILINCVAFVPFALIQGAGRPDLTAKLHLAELPLYLLGIWVLTKLYGIEGAALASLGRFALDTVVLFVIAWRLLRFHVPVKLLLGAGAAIAFMFGVGTVVATPVVRISAVLLVLVVFALIAWHRLLMPDERAIIRRWLRLSPSYAEPS